MLVGMVLVVSAFGGCWVLVPTLVSEIFGFTHFGSNYQVLKAPLSDKCDGVKNIINFITRIMFYI
jgi:hypothetical protein